MISAPLSLESFEDVATDPQQRNATYQTGYDEGFAAAYSQAKSENDALTDEFVQTVSDMNFVFTEARAQLLASFSPLIHTIVEKILPRAVSQVFAHHVAETVLQAADTSVAPILHVHPDQSVRVADILRQHGQENQVIADPDLSEHAAWISTAQGETYLDADRLLDQINEALSVATQTEQRTNGNG